MIDICPLFWVRKIVMVDIQQNKTACFMAVEQTEDE